ncbi:MAG: carboxypeptidase regulatory-like domain-containing protein [Prevotella sp.]
MRIHNHCFLFILLLSLVFPINLKADGVKGRVVDEETGMPIADANIQLVVKIYNGQTTSVSSTDSLGLFCLSSYFTGRAVISISFLGYKTETVSEYLFSDNESSDTIDLGDIKLKRSATMLKALEVTGHLPKVTMSGDTIVFNPEAIKLEDNAKILQLLRKLPGVRQHKDGRFYWNDKPIRLMMNGKDTFGEALVTQLPADIVKKLKLYDRRSKLARHTGVSDGKEDNVLDIQIKPGFMDKFYGTAQAQYLTTDHYYAHANGIKLSNASPMMFLLNTNNINESCKMNYNSLTASTSTDYGKGIFGGLSLSHNWQTEGADDSNRISFSPFLGHHDKWSDSYSSKQNFFPGERQTFTLSKTHSYKHELSPSFDLATDLYTDSVNELSLLGSFSYTKTHSKIENIMARYRTLRLRVLSHRRYFQCPARYRTLQPHTAPQPQQEHDQQRPGHSQADSPMDPLLTTEKGRVPLECKQPTDEFQCTSTCLPLLRLPATTAQHRSKPVGTQS